MDVSRSLWLRYIEFELNLDSLRGMRVKRMGIKGEDSKLRESTVRLHSLFYRATRRFRSDLDLWLQWVKFSKDRGSSNVLSRSLGSAVLIHPLVPDLWIIAADWEFESDCNMETARALMLRGIRANPQSETMYLEYFRLELKYLKKILFRIDLVTHKEKPKETYDLDMEEEEEDSVERLALENDNLKAPVELPAEGRITDSNFAKGAICKTIYKTAIGKFPRFEYCSQFLAIAQDNEAPQELVDDLSEITRETFAGDLEYWKWCFVNSGETDMNAAVVAEHLQGPAKWEYLVFCEMRMGNDAEAICTVCERANKAQEVSPTLYSIWIKAVLSTEGKRKALTIGKNGVALYPQNETLWFDYLTAHIVNLKGKPGPVLALFKQAIKQIGSNQKSFLIRNLFLRFLFSFPTQEVEDIHLAVGDDVNCALVALDFCQRGWGEGETEKVRAFSSKLLDFSGSVEVYQKVIDWEKNPEIKRKLYQDGCDRFGAKSASIWLNWAKFETVNGGLDAAGKIHYLAKKGLKGVHLSEYFERLAADEEM
jgi:hypothetical protein